MQQSPTTDEIAYLPAGLSHWQYGHFELAAVNPPLTRLVAAIPVLFAGPKTDWTHYEKRHEPGVAHAVGEDFIRANGSRSPWLFTIARWACMPFSLLGLWTCYRWARELYGTSAGLLAGVLWCFCPNILAHGPLITPDVGGAAFGVCAAYTFWRWTRLMNWPRALLAGLALGFAQLARTTLIILIPLWLLVALIRVATNNQRHDTRACKLAAFQLFAIYAIALFVVNDGYLFVGTGRRLGDFRFVSLALGGPAAKETGTGNRFIRSPFQDVPLPLPADYVLGFDSQKRQFEEPWSSRSYLRGHWRNGGWWYYYLYGFLVKVPIGTLALLLMAVVARIVDRGRGHDWQSELCVLLPPLIILALVSSQTGFNRHFRYVLAVFPFLFVWMAQIAAVQGTLGRWLRPLAVTACAGSVMSSLWAYPHALSYFNECVGGPLHGHAHLLNSNISWGQDLLYLKRWLTAHPSARPFHLAFAGDFPLEAIGLAFPFPPPAAEKENTIGGSRKARGPDTGWYAISVDYLRGDTYPKAAHCEYFLRFKPVAMAGYSVYIYHLQDEDGGNTTRAPDN